MDCTRMPEVINNPIINRKVSGRAHSDDSQHAVLTGERAHERVAGGLWHTEHVYDVLGAQVVADVAQVVVVLQHEASDEEKVRALHLPSQSSRYSYKSLMASNRSIETVNVKNLNTVHGANVVGQIARKLQELLSFTCERTNFGAASNEHTIAGATCRPSELHSSYAGPSHRFECILQAQSKSKQTD